ncbi:MAG: type II secretion system minor pseudopilin GspK [Oleiphilus sp.]
MLLASKRSKAQRAFSLPSRQKGVALMLVIFVFALVSILAVGMYNRQHIFVQTAGNVMAQSQAYQYAVASEIYGKRLLKADWDEDKDKNEFVDDLEQVQNSILLPVEDAFLEAQFNDVQGKLNINDLIDLKGKVNLEIKESFVRLFKRLAIETIKVETIIDWLDENQDPEGFEGMEDGEYLSLDPPYRNAGQSMRDITELRLLPNVSNEDFQKLLPHVTVLPQGRSPVNVNTASPEVLQSLTETMSDQQAKTLVEQREEKPWKDIESFKADPLVAASVLKTQYIGVNSEFFEIATRISLSDRVVRLVSLVYRAEKDGVMQVIRRDQSQKYLITKEKVSL